jgi:(2Fe-2S) ferredoxin
MTRRHLFVCTNPRSSGKPACGNTGVALVARVQQLLIERGAPEALVTSCGCLGPCFDGPNAVLYPEGVWYGHLEIDDAGSLVDHLSDGIVGPKRIDPPGAND